jgi:hypothetical protein
MDNSMRHNDRTISPKISDAKLERLPHPDYSLDLSQGDFWLFGMLKGNMKDRAFQTIEKIMDTVILIWNGVTFDQLQNVLLNCTEHLESGISNGEGYDIAQHYTIY